MSCMACASFLQSLGGLSVKITDGRVPVFEIVVSLSFPHSYLSIRMRSMPFFLLSLRIIVRSLKVSTQRHTVAILNSNFSIFCPVKIPSLTLISPYPSNDFISLIHYNKTYLILEAFLIIAASSCDTFRNPPHYNADLLCSSYVRACAWQSPSA